MYRRLVPVLLVLLAPLALGAEPAAPARTKATRTAKAEKTAKAAEAKELAGMSVLGNNDTPKALYIVPWKSSEIGAEADLSAGLLNDAMAPVDKEVFIRQLQYYEIRNQQQ